MRLGQILAARALALDEIRHRVAAEAVEAAVEPEAHHVEHGPAHRGVVVVQVGLVAEEPMPVVFATRRIEGPVGLLGVDEDDARL